MNSRGMNVPGLEFQCFTGRYNIIEVGIIAYIILSRNLCPKDRLC
jgi:hypothetical protein